LSLAWFGQHSSIAPDISEAIDIMARCASSDEPTMDTADPAVGSNATDRAITKAVIMRKVCIAALFAHLAISYALAQPSSSIGTNTLKFHCTLLRQIAGTFLIWRNQLWRYSPALAIFPKNQRGKTLS
jgi:hypothetical protein